MLQHEHIVEHESDEGIDMPSMHDAPSLESQLEAQVGDMGEMD